jgi:hypothetical protein
LIKGIIKNRRYLFSIFKQYSLINQNKKFGIGTLFDIKKLERFKSSNTLFIMGSGPSICDMSDEQFRHISKHDSFGFTNWTMHDHVPTFYMNEFKSRTTELDNCQEQELANLVAKKDLYQNTALIFRAGSTIFKNIKGIEKYGFPFDNVFLAIDIGVNGRNKNEFIDSLKLLKNLGIIDINQLMLQKTSSLFRCIIFAYKLGYKKIVLCGIDLTGDQYFFEKEKEKYLKKGLIFPKLMAYRNKSHKTNDPEISTGGMAISDVVYATNDVLLSPNSIKLSVSSDQSYFYPDFPLYDWESENN